MEAIIELLADSEKASVVMQSLAGYIVYLYPGIISIYLYNFFNAKTTHNTQAFLAKSFAISYLYNVLLLKISSKTNCISMNGIRYNIVLLIFSFSIPYFWHSFRKSEFFAKVCGWFEISTSVTDVPFELLEDKDEIYTCLKVYMKDDPYLYIGYIGEYEYESENDKFIILTGYKKYLIKDNLEEKLIVDNKADQYNEKVYIKLGDIKIIEKIAEDRANREIYKSQQE